VTEPASALFRVEETFAIHSRRLFVLVGEIVEGTVRTGMLVQVSLNGAVFVTAPVSGVEFVDGPGRRSRIGLTVRYEDDDDLAFWRGLNIGGGMICPVTEPGGPSSPAAEPPRRDKPKPWWKPW
jgi:hypothetical protein